MNMIFGDKLRRELVELVSRSEPVRNRAPSNGSDKLSSDGHELWGKDNSNILSLEALEVAQEVTSAHVDAD
jgi:hypothetical protein